MFALERGVLGIGARGTIDLAVKPLVHCLLGVITVAAAILWVTVADQGANEGTDRQSRSEYHDKGHDNSNLEPA